MNVKLGVNIDHVATLRQARKDLNPDPVEAARVALSAGADMIVMHLRKDRRHVQESDIERVRRHVKCYLHMEMAADEEMEKLAIKLAPDSVCLVPEEKDEVTTQGGLKIKEKDGNLSRIIKNISSKGIGVSLFLNPNPQDIRAAYKLGADTVELCTKAYAEVWGKKNQEKELEKLQLACCLVKELNMSVHAGHGLDYYNVRPVAQIDGMECLNIGFSIISRSVFIGLKNAVSSMKSLIS